jgi:hypothetical protein
MVVAGSKFCYDGGFVAAHVHARDGDAFAGANGKAPWLGGERGE